MQAELSLRETSERVRLFWQMREGRFRRYSSIRGAV